MNLPVSDARRWRLRCYERQLEVVDDAIHDNIVGDEGDELEWIKSEAEQAGISIEVY